MGGKSHGSGTEAFWRVGDLLTVGLVFLGSRLAPSPRVFAAVNVGLVAVWLAIVIRIARPWSTDRGGPALSDVRAIAVTGDRGRRDGLQLSLSLGNALRLRSFPRCVRERAPSPLAAVKTCPQRGFRGFGIRSHGPPKTSVGTDRPNA